MSWGPLSAACAAPPNRRGRGHHHGAPRPAGRIMEARRRPCRQPRTQRQAATSRRIARSPLARRQTTKRRMPSATPRLRPRAPLPHPTRNQLCDQLHRQRPTATAMPVLPTVLPSRNLPATVVPGRLPLLSATTQQAPVASPEPATTQTADTLGDAQPAPPRAAPAPEEQTTATKGVIDDSAALAPPPLPAVVMPPPPPQPAPAPLARLVKGAGSVARAIPPIFSSSNASSRRVAAARCISRGRSRRVAAMLSSACW